MNLLFIVAIVCFLSAGIIAAYTLFAPNLRIQITTKTNKILVNISLSLVILHGIFILLYFLFN